MVRSSILRLSDSTRSAGGSIGGDRLVAIGDPDCWRFGRYSHTSMKKTSDNRSTTYVPIPDIPARSEAAATNAHVNCDYSAAASRLFRRYGFPIGAGGSPTAHP